MNDGAIVELYTQAHCGPCRKVEQFLEERGLDFVRHDVLVDPAALDTIASRGFMATPVTRVGERWIAGFKKRELEQAIEEIATSETPPSRSPSAPAD
jgi:glutaredoxin